jgi:hypothetical protein
MLFFLVRFCCLRNRALEIQATYKESIPEFPSRLNEDVMTHTMNLVFFKMQMI